MLCGVREPYGVMGLGSGTVRTAILSRTVECSATQTVGQVERIGGWSYDNSFEFKSHFQASPMRGGCPQFVLYRAFGCPSDGGNDFGHRYRCNGSGSSQGGYLDHQYGD